MAHASTLSTGVEIPEDGVPIWDGRMQYTTRMEKRPEPGTIRTEADYLKWKWRREQDDYIARIECVGA